MFSFFHFPLLSLYFFFNSCCIVTSAEKKPFTFTVPNRGSCQINSVNSNRSKHLVCNITGLTNITVNNAYKKHFTNVILNFTSNTIFEKVVRNNYKVFHQLFIINNTQSINSTFSIILQKSNQTTIDATYIKNIFSKDAKPYRLLDIKILNYSNNQDAPRIHENLKTVNISQFFIHIPCNHLNGATHYNITPRSFASTKDPICQNLSTNPRIPSQQQQQQRVPATIASTIGRARLITTTSKKATTGTEQLRIIQTTARSVTSRLTTVRTTNFSQRSLLTTVRTSVPSITSLRTKVEVKPTTISIKDSAKISTDGTYQEESSSYSTADLFTTKSISLATELITPMKTVYPFVNNSKLLTSLRIINPTTVSTETSRRSTKRFLVLLLSGLATITISASLIVTYLVLKCRPKADYILNENSSELFDISKTPSTLDSSHISKSLSQRNEPIFESNVRTFDDDF